MFTDRKRRNALATLSRFAGWQLAHANYHLSKTGVLVPFGMTGTVSVWSGSSLNVTMIGVERQEQVVDAAGHWLMMDHGKVDHVGVAMDAWLTPSGGKDNTAAVCVSVRPHDFNTRIIIYQPYTLGTADTPIVFERPVIDAPLEFKSVLADRDLILKSVLAGRKGPPFLSSGHYR